MEKEQKSDKWYRNFYRCPDDNTEWDNEDDCTCNDRCPECGKEIEPYKSEDITDEQE